MASVDVILQHDTYHSLLPFIPKTFTNPKLPVVPCCAVCDPPEDHRVRDDLITCKLCKCVSYCSRDHQKADAENHKSVCRYVQKCKKKRNTMVSRVTPERYEELVGLFGTTPETAAIVAAKRDYMLALTVTCTNQGVTLALEEGLDCLRLCRGDHLGIRNAVPALMLMTRSFQKCYDFIKWWATFDPHRTVDLDDLSVPMFTVKDAKVSERIPKGFFHPKTSVFHWAALCYMKTELYFGLETNLAYKKIAQESAPASVLESLMSVLSLSPFAPYEEDFAQLKKDAGDSFTLTDKANKFFWRSVVDVHSMSGDVSPGGFIRGGPFEVQNWLIPYGLLYALDVPAREYVEMHFVENASK